MRWLPASLDELAALAETAKMIASGCDVGSDRHGDGGTRAHLVVEGSRGG